MKPPKRLALWIAEHSNPVVTFWNAERTRHFRVRTVKAGIDVQGCQIYAMPEEFVLHEGWSTFTLSHLPSRSIFDSSFRLGGPPGS